MKNKEVGVSRRNQIRIHLTLSSPISLMRTAARVVQSITSLSVPLLSTIRRLTSSLPTDRATGGQSRVS